ncbi:MAG: thioesterase family protein [Actinomycetota bacterium]
MRASFALATAITPDAGTPGRYAAVVPDGWDIAGNTNGGVLLAIAGRALLVATGRADPVTMTAHYLTPARPGPVTIDTTVLKSGRRFATATATVTADDRPVLTVVGTCGTLTAEPLALLVVGGPPALPPPEDCVALHTPEAPPFYDCVDVRLHPDDAGFRDGTPSGHPRVRGWFRLRDEPADPIALLCAVDGFPPTTFNARLPVSWTPTVELTAHVRARPADGWLACGFVTRFVSGGLLEVDAEVWDRTGTLVAQSRQLALVPDAGE